MSMKAIDKDDATAEAVGEKLAEVLKLRRRGLEQRFDTAWGTKTAAGLARTVLRILQEQTEGRSA